MLLYAQLAVLVVLVTLNTWLGIDKNLYFSVWWWDIPTHFLGGVWVGLCAGWLFALNKKKITVAQCAFFALAVGAGWEVFEHMEAVAGNIFMPYWVDTTKDLIIDTLGGMLAGFLMLRIQKVWRK
jgi:uncharacterized membrane protein YjdF